MCENPAAQNMPHEEEYDDNNYESIDETAILPLLQNSYDNIDVVIVNLS